MENEKKEIDINSVAMQVILHAGDGRAKVDEALEAMAKTDFELAEKLLDEAEKEIVKAHIAQTEAIQAQVSGENIDYSLLFTHAQDTVMTINTELRMARKMMPIFRMLNDKAERNSR
ncbi:PTS lactose/cellobiose transporter subunit IIA [Anaerolactibacter massiliensis]|uniref:PTS lactose/cellobiose transporter subunit IIA n=1 Tax=Anaerolactibacter massiliensis TaxID=2044573 RepID=UPI001957E66E|nr:PTS lactose/cellobiose transporter subunit IIA [Anaerolactibacter massiliensis]